MKLPPQVPSTGNALSRIVGRALMRVTGWRFVGEFPDVPRFVCLVAPHTSNWDFFVALAAKWALGLGATWIGKNSIFRWPVAGFLRRIGGVPVDRNSPHGVVHQMVDAFATAPRMVFVLAPEGTRKRVEHWRSGYWHVAHEARVPIVPVGLDYARKTVVIGPRSSRRRRSSRTKHNSARSTRQSAASDRRITTQERVAS